MMISLSDQFSAARLTQLDNGFNLMRSLGEQALDRADRLFALQLDASRAAVEQSSNAMRQLLSARDPRDLLAIGSQSQQQWRSVFDFSRELLSIASGLGSTMLRADRTDSLSAPAQEAQVAAEAFERIGADTASIAASEAANAATAPASAPATAPASAPATAPASAASIILQADTPRPGSDFVLPTETPPEPAVIVTSTVEPAATPNPIALATGEALDLPVAPPHPLAASVPVEVAVEIEMPKIEPVVAAPPPPAPSNGPVETRGSKGRKRSS